MREYDQSYLPSLYIAPREPLKYQLQGLKETHVNKSDGKFRNLMMHVATLLSLALILMSGLPHLYLLCSSRRCVNQNPLIGREQRVISFEKPAPHFTIGLTPRAAR